MSFNRLSYDACAAKVAVNDSVGPGLYQMSTPVLYNSCFQTNPQIITQKGSVSMNANADWRFFAGPVDVESDLLNLNRPATRCPSGKYEPKCSNCGVITSGQPCGQGVSQSCFKCSRAIPKGGMCNQDMLNMSECVFPVEDTRLSNPPSTLRGTGWNRFEPLCIDPQANVFFPGTQLINTRNMHKDNFQLRVRTPQINSMNPPPQEPFVDAFGRIAYRAANARMIKPTNTPQIRDDAFGPIAYVPPTATF